MLRHGRGRRVLSAFTAIRELRVHFFAHRNHRRSDRGHSAVISHRRHGGRPHLPLPARPTPRHGRPPPSPGTRSPCHSPPARCPQSPPPSSPFPSPQPPP